MSTVATAANHSAEKERVRVALIKLAQEMTTRPVTNEDLGQFRRFQFPDILYSARGRSLSEAEALAVIQLLRQPQLMQSVQNPAIQSPKKYPNCDCHRQRGCSECGAKDFVDYSFSNVRAIRFPPSSQERTGKINNIPFSIFAQPSGGEENVEPTLRY